MQKRSLGYTILKRLVGHHEDGLSIQEQLLAGHTTTFITNSFITVLSCGKIIIFFRYVGILIDILICNN